MDNSIVTLIEDVKSDFEEFNNDLEPELKADQDKFLLDPKNLETEINSYDRPNEELCGQFDIKLEVKIEDDTRICPSPEEITNDTRQPSLLAKKKINKKVKYIELQRVYCGYCTFVSNQKRILAKHIFQKHYCLYKCQSCSYTAPSKADLQLHKKSHYLECVDCRFVSKSRESLKEHRIANHSTHKCDLCDFITKYKSNMLDHLNVKHYKNKTYICQHCEYSTLHRSAITAHAKTHNGDLYKCEFCKYTTGRTTDLKTHQNAMHLKKKVYKCQFCDYTNLYKNVVTRHEKFDHASDALPALKCLLCDYTTKKQKLLKQHCEAQHSTTTVICEYCDYSTTSRNALRFHLKKNHSSTDAFKCDICDFASAHLKELKNHRKQRHAKSCVECGHCGFLCTSKSALTKHIYALHLKIKEFRCELCPYASFAKRCLRNHLKSQHGK